MKKWLIVLSVLSVISCKKSNSSDQTASTLKFKANGTQYEWNGVATDTSVVGAAVYCDTADNNLYTLGGFDFRNLGYNKLSFDIMAGGDLHSGTFNYPGANNTDFIGECTIGDLSNSTVYWNFGQDDSVSVIVTEVSNGFASGTFKGSITRNSGSEKMVITEGQFQHVKIIRD